MRTLTPELIAEYTQLFNNCVIKADKFAAVDQVINSILAGRKHYDQVETQINVPWYFTGIVHSLEGGVNFKTHLHNGDPLTARTKNFPNDRPRPGTPPFTWLQSAVDALQIKKLHTWTDWSIPGLLYQFERYNGFGYRPIGINSPYLWSFSNHYLKGKFIRDHVFSENAVSKQVGAAVLLRRMSEKQIAVRGELDTISQIKLLGATVPFAPKRFNPKAEELQILLNSVGLHLRIDGFAGKMTSNAFFQVSGKFLKGDGR